MSSARLRSSYWNASLSGWVLTVYIRGKQINIAGTASIKRAVEQGTTVTVTVKLGGVQVYKKKFDLCKELGKVGGGCPFKPSKPTLTKSYEIPKALPKVRSQPVVVRSGVQERVPEVNY